jgi:hypothetical protein
MTPGSQRNKAMKIRARLKAGKPVKDEQRAWLAEYDRAKGAGGKVPETAGGAPVTPPVPPGPSPGALPTVDLSSLFRQAAAELPSTAPAAPEADPPPAPATPAPATPGPAQAPPTPSGLGSSPSSPAPLASAGMSPLALEARAKALRLIIGIAADAFEEYQGAIEETMGRPWILPRTWWKEEWLPLFVSVANAHLPPSVSGLIVEGTAVAMPPAALMRAGHRLRKDGYQVGVRGEPGRARRDPKPETAEAKNDQAPVPPAVPVAAIAGANGKLSAREIFGGRRR